MKKSKLIRLFLTGSFHTSRPNFLPAVIILLVSFSFHVLYLSAAEKQGPAEQRKPELAVQTGHVGSVVRVAWSPDGKYVTTLGSRLGQDGTLKVWEAEGGRLVADLRPIKFTAFVWSPDGKYIAAAGLERTLIWDTNSGRFVAELKQAQAADDVAWSPDGRFLAVLTNRGVLLWKTQDWQLKVELEAARGALGPIAWSPEGDYLVTASIVWEMPTAQAVALLENYERHFMGWEPMAWSPRGNFLAAGNGNNLRIWEAHTGRLLFQTAHSSRIKTVDWSPDGHYVAAGSFIGLVWKIVPRNSDNKVSLDVSFLKELKGHSKMIESIQWSSDGKYLSTGSSDATACIWNVPGWDMAAVLEGHKREILSMAWSPKAKYLATASADRTARVWEPEAGRVITELKAQVGGQRAVSWSPDAKLLAMGGMESPARVWEVASGQVITAFKTPKRIDSGVAEFWKLPGASEVLKKPTPVSNVRSLAWSPGADKLAVLTTNGDALLEVWEPQLGQLVSRWKAGQKRVYSVLWSPDCKYLATAGSTRKRGEAGTKVWEAATGRLVAEMDSQRDDEDGVTVRSLAWSPDGRYLARGGTNIAAGIWDLRRNRLVEPFVSARWVAWSNDGDFLAVGTKIWDVASRQFISELRRDTQDTKIIATSIQQLVGALQWDTRLLSSLAFSPDTRYLAGAAGWAARIWDRSNGRQVAVLAGHTGRVTGVSWSPDGRFLITSSEDGSARLWAPLTAELLATLIIIGEERDWLVTTPDGFFDGSPAAWKLVGWHNDPLRYLNVDPVELYFNEFYYPGLLADILAGNKPEAPRSISQLDRRQPEVRLLLADGQAPAGRISSRTVRVKLEVSEAPAGQINQTGSGAGDLRLFRNGSLVKVWRGDVLEGKSSRVTLEATIPIVGGENRLTAYAFNRDNIKSPDATLVLTGADSLKRAGTAYILAIGVDQYSNSDYNLGYAVADARVFAEELSRQQTLLGKFARIEVIPLFNQEATKANILGVLARLAGSEMGEIPPEAPAVFRSLKPVEPEDVVFIHFSGHGTAHGPRFYLFPHDLGYQGSRRKLDETGLKTILAHSISDIELEQAFEPVDASRLLLVIDACNSGQALEAEERRRGPMNSKGLAQLAYEKGMYILTAAQGYQAAIEAVQFGHGLLSYALVEEGLKTPMADVTPKDGLVMLREWLDYTTLRVPQLQIEMMRQARRQGKDLAFVEGEEVVSKLSKRSLQRPRVFYRREPEARPFVVARHGRTP